MAILKILQYPDQRLRCAGQVVTDIKAVVVQRIIDNMLETLAHTEHCFGLAATQLDIQNPPTITVINHPEQEGIVLCLVNPVIVAATGKQVEEEGCQSIFPDALSAKVVRAADVTVEALDRDGQPVQIVATGFFAKGLQHEIDHLNGILYVDRLSPLRRALFERQRAKL